MKTLAQPDRRSNFELPQLRVLSSAHARTHGMTYMQLGVR